MLKFSDLSVDYKSFENSFDSLMKLIPGSYYPLLIMYLAHKGMLKLEANFDKDDPCTLVSVDGNTLSDFFGEDLMKDVIRKGPDFDEESDFETAWRKLSESILKDRDVYVMSPFFNLLPMILAGKSVALVADVPEGDQVLDLINILGIKNPDPNTSAALLFFSIMLMSKYSVDSEADSSLSEEEKASGVSHRIWVEDFDYAMNKILSYSGEDSCIQPKEITRLILTQYKGGSIYNPFAGITSYNIQRNYECSVSDYFHPVKSLGEYYYGEEINTEVWALGKLRLLAYKCDSENYILGDSRRWREGKANNILCTPPFGSKIENEFGKMEYADHFVIRRGLELLVEDGLLACVVPLSFMSRKDTEDVRERIIKDGLLESIVYLPDNLFKGTSVRTAILFIRKTVHSTVTLINATSAVYSMRGKANILDVEFVANLLYHQYYTFNFIFDSEANMVEKLSNNTFYKLRVSVSKEKIEKNKFNLTPGLYFLSNLIPPQGFTLKMMGDLVKGVSKTTKDAGRGRIIRPTFLSKDEFTPLNVVSLQEGDYKKGYGVIERSALVFSPLSSLRPTILLNPNGEKVYYKPDTLQAVYVKEDAIIPEYLIIELNKPYVQEQIRLLAKGVIPRLGLNEFFSLSLYIPSSRNLTQTLAKESEAVNAQKAIFYSKINAELVELKDKQHDDYVKMLRQRKHRIGQLLGDLVPGFDTLDDFRKGNGGVLKDTDVIAFKTGETVSDYFTILHNIINRIDTLVKNLTDKEEWGNPSMIDIDDFLNNLPNNHLKENFDFQFFMRHDVHLEDNELDSRKYIVLANESELSTVFENIIKNASKYGFTDEERNDYRIRISVDDDMIDTTPAVRICVSNNGTPIHPSLDRNRFFEWGYGNGDGIGTWQLKDIIEHYDGTIHLNEYPDDVAGFCTEYEIVLPLTIDE